MPKSNAQSQAQKPAAKPTAAPPKGKNGLQPSDHGKPSPAGKGGKPAPVQTQAAKNAQALAPATQPPKPAEIIPEATVPREPLPMSAGQSEREVLYPVIDLLAMWDGPFSLTVTKAKPVVREVEEVGEDGKKSKTWVVEAAGCGQLDAETAKSILGWETEEDYLARMQQGDPTLTQEDCRFKAESEVWVPRKVKKDGTVKEAHLEKKRVGNWVLTIPLKRQVTKDVEKSRKETGPDGREVTIKYKEKKTTTEDVDMPVVCWNNLANREFDRNWVKGRKQDILNGQWRLNGESMVIGKTGLTISIQHRLIALIQADMEWEALLSVAGDKRGMVSAYPAWPWPQRPTIAGLIVRGVEEDAETMATIDNTRPRGEADEGYTSGLFMADADGKPIANVDRRLLSAMLKSGVDFVWDRSRAGTLKDWMNKVRTNSTARDFRQRHPRVVDCIRHLFEVNKNRGISALFTSPGRCAGMMYLMAGANSDVDEYISADLRDERVIDFGCWELAENFWREMAKGEGNALVKIIRGARRPVIGQSLKVFEQEGLDSGYVFPHKVVKSKENENPIQPEGGTEEERLAVVARAWHAFVDKGGDVGKLDFPDAQPEYDRKWDEVEAADGSIETLLYGFGLAEEDHKITFGGIDQGSLSEAAKPVNRHLPDEGDQVGDGAAEEGGGEGGEDEQTITDVVGEVVEPGGTTLDAANNEVGEAEAEPAEKFVADEAPIEADAPHAEEAKQSFAEINAAKAEKVKNLQQEMAAKRQHDIQRTMTTRKPKKG